MAQSPALNSPIVVPRPLPSANGRFRFRSDGSSLNNGTEAIAIDAGTDGNTTGLPRYLGGDAVISAGQRVRMAMGGGGAGNPKLRGSSGGSADSMRFASAQQQQKSEDEDGVAAGPGSKNLQWTYFDAQAPPPWMSPPWSAAQPGRDTPYVAPSTDPSHNPQTVGGVPQ